jgi:hypothetical protein
MSVFVLVKDLSCWPGQPVSHVNHEVTGFTHSIKIHEIDLV